MHENETQDARPAETAGARAVEVGQLWRDDLDGYLYRVVVVDEDHAWVRHPNAKQGGIQTVLAWFDHYHLVRDVPA